MHNLSKTVDTEIIKRPDLLAHSAFGPTSVPDFYEGHISRVRLGAKARAQQMLCFALDARPDYVRNVEVAATFHDLGKLDAENQLVLARSRSERMPWDHIDAGVAHLLARRNYMAAWLVRAHHAPGLPCQAEHFDQAVGLKLRGRRRGEHSEHKKQMLRTDDLLDQYLMAHEAATGLVENVCPAKAPHGLELRLALSCLVDADHTDTAEFDGVVSSARVLPRWQERLTALDSYVELLGKSGNGNRNDQRAEFYKTARSGDIVDDGFVCCEAPVGLGKTTAVTAFLMKSAAERNLRHLFVVAPYTNVIDETVNVLRKAVSLNGEDPRTVVVAHHHRADFSSRSDRDIAALWRAPIIVTTSVQFFETLAACSPSALRKLHELPGSAIFLDEAHAALPANLWPQNWRWLQELAKNWNCRVAFASGSLAKFWENPEIINPNVKVAEIMSAPMTKASVDMERQRVRYVTMHRMDSPSELIQRVVDKPGPRLLILNTVQSAAVVAQKMRNLGAHVYHVSTALCPNDRSRSIQQIRQRLETDDKDWTVVSTSCLEAGLNLSFRTGFRERFSTASLIQTGGRVNRNGEYSQAGPGLVFDFILEDPENKITRHPGALYSGEALKRQLSGGDFQKMSPAELVSSAMAEELRATNFHDPLSKAECERNYPAAAEYGRVIQTNTRIVVIDHALLNRLRCGEKPPFQEVLMGSVQIWATKIEALELSRIEGRQELYSWNLAYDDFLGYMAGVLEMQHASAEVI